MTTLKADGLSHPSFSDPIIAARMEAIRLLADGLSESVAVMDQQYHVLYANESAWSDQSVNPVRSHRPATCYEVFAHRREPCGICPASKVFETPDVQSLSCASGDATACGMRQAFPLTGADGKVASMLVLFAAPPIRQKQGEPADLKTVSSAPEGLGDLIGRSAAMAELFEMVTLVAQSHATVLIQCESGTGKELVAQTIHRLSPRQRHPFIVVDCGSLPETLLESELFGHVKGAFTGAAAHKSGLFEQADGGTIFLDEIADTTPTFQAKLLRVLQEGEIKRVGGNRPIKIDVRVLSATNKDLHALIKAKRFRQDLYYRLAVLPIFLPPLRDRHDDIPLLVQHFVAVSCRRHRQPIRSVPEEVMQGLRQRDWPGNVRELQHAIERAVATTTGPLLLSPDRWPGTMKGEQEDLWAVSRNARKHAEQARIINALRETSGNRLRAAKRLKISRASLYLKLRQYQISPADLGKEPKSDEVRPQS